MQNENWLFEQCLKCRHLITKKNMNTGKKTYACDNGTTIMTNYKFFNYVDENDEEESKCDWCEESGFDTLYELV